MTRTYRIGSILFAVGAMLLATVAAAQAVEVCMLMDTSSSLPTTDFDAMKTLVSGIIGALPTDSSVALGVVRFATGASVVVPLTTIDSSATAGTMQSSVTAMAYTGGYSYTRDGFDTCINSIFTTDPGVSRLVYFMTNGVPNPPLAQGVCVNGATTATDLANINAVTHIVGQGTNFSETPYLCLVSDPATDIDLVSAFSDVDIAGVVTYVDSLNAAQGSPTPSTIPTQTPTLAPTDTATATPTDTATAIPTDTATAIPTDTATAIPTATATATPEDGGFIPPDSTTAKCENLVAKHVSKLAGCILKCHKKQAKAALAGKPFDEEACEEGTGKPVSCRAKYDTASAKLLAKGICPGCLDAAAQGTLADTVTTFLENQNGALYCAGATGFGGDDTGNVPPDRTTAKCENTVGKKVAKLAGCITKCHKKQADAALAGKPFDEEACEEGTGKPVSCRAKYDTASAKLVAKGICPGCLDAAAQGTLADTVTTFLENQNGLLYCAGTAPLPTP